MTIELQKEEEILFHHNCSHMRGIEAVGGKIWVTNKRIVYKSHKFNFQNHNLEILKKDIKEVDSNARLYKRFPGRGFSITLKNGDLEVFSPRNRRQCVEAVEKLK